MSAKKALPRATGVVPMGVKGGSQATLSMSKKRTSLLRKPAPSAPPKMTMQPPKAATLMPVRPDGWLSSLLAMTCTSPRPMAAPSCAILRACR